MKNMLSKIKYLGVLVLIISFSIGCNEDDDSLNEPKSDFSYMSNDLEVSFFSASNYAVSLEWDFGDGNTSTNVNPVHNYESVGTYTVTLKATGAVGTTPSVASKVIVVEQINPIASFSYEVTDLTVVFTNTSDLGVTYEWDFGDGTISTEENPSYTYSEPGEYTVILTVNGVEGSTPSTFMASIAVGVSVFVPVEVENYDFSLPGTGRVVNWADIPGWSSDAATVDSGVEEGGWWMPADDNDYSGVSFTGDTSAYNLTDHVISTDEEFKVNMLLFDIWNGPNVTITLYYNNGNGVRNVLDTQTFSVNPGEWNLVEFTTIAPIESNGARIGIEVENASGDGGDGWSGFDDVKLFVK
ncbi:PKD domain-containing protein [Mangrovimonas sp. AS39]|uniref:PKD domain-containing protein n=1 Tax=Mangrovimonas futianensis TaxID=2895523 RepID=UPI001E41EE19|nr:PKD domain-containing protein [Mangrovimonas futianensis]MCF1192322.1 PKD domain-containing protein [Mangrovimonas futianensis]MCF1195929.1 PKD domain-containing protein [Mangrovimonas futianensis]MCF1423232.1 PKD domain-containing protein [Mangrovimonas futianensis]